MTDHVFINAVNNYDVTTINNLHENGYDIYCHDNYMLRKILYMRIKKNDKSDGNKKMFEYVMSEQYLVPTVSEVSKNNYYLLRLMICGIKDNNVFQIFDKVLKSNINDSFFLLKYKNMLVCEILLKKFISVIFKSSYKILIHFDGISIFGADVSLNFIQRNKLHKRKHMTLRNITEKLKYIYENDSLKNTDFIISVIENNILKNEWNTRTILVIFCLCFYVFYNAENICSTIVELISVDKCKELLNDPLSTSGSIFEIICSKFGLFNYDNLDYEYIISLIKKHNIKTSCILLTKISDSKNGSLILINLREKINSEEINSHEIIFFIDDLLKQF